MNTKENKFLNFELDPYEPRYSVSQLFETGIEITHWFVIRNGETIIYKEENTKKWKQ